MVDGRSRRESRSLPPGQGSRGREGPRSMGWVQGKGGAKAPFHGLDEVVSMKWSGVLGAGTPLKSMGAGRAKSPCEWSSGDTIEWLWNGVDPLQEPRPGGCNGGAQRVPLPRWFCTTKHILRKRRKRRKAKSEKAKEARKAKAGERRERRERTRRRESKGRKARLKSRRDAKSPKTKKGRQGMPQRQAREEKTKTDDRANQAER